jgi:hypothetical protein
MKQRKEWRAFDTLGYPVEIDEIPVRGLPTFAPIARRPAP